MLGISGIVNGLVKGDKHEWRPLFLSGLALASIPLSLLLPGSFAALPATYSYTRAITGGLLVGLGAAMGNGCTSGHGQLCVNS